MALAGDALSVFAFYILGMEYLVDTVRLEYRGRVRDGVECRGACTMKEFYVCASCRTDSDLYSFREDTDG